MNDLSDAELDGFALLAEHTSAFVRGDALAAMAYELRRLRSGQLTSSEARVLQWAASLALALETDPPSAHELVSAMGKLLVLELSAAAP